jgi:HEAT repeat protein
MRAIEGLGQIASGEADCSICKGKGRAKYTTKRGRSFVAVERQCHVCDGKGKEYVSPALQVKACRELAKYASPSVLRDSATTILAALLKSDSESVRLEAARAIAAIPIRSARPHAIM